MNNREIIEWLLKGDVSIQYQVHRDLLDNERHDLREKIAKEGWGAKYLSKRWPDGYWSEKFYQPKWISAHYTLLELKNLGVTPDNKDIRQSINRIAKEEKSLDGGVNPSVTLENSDVCVNGMFLNYASYFLTNEALLKSIIDFILSQQLADGGFNCRYNSSGAVHSSLHSTLSVLEGITEYLNNGYSYKSDELEKVSLASKEFILLHQLFISDRTGQIIKKDFLRFVYPCRWKYDILRALDHFQYSKTEWDKRMQPAIDVIMKKRTADMIWKAQTNHPGKVYFIMEKAGEPGRWNTLRALRVLKHFNIVRFH